MADAGGALIQEATVNITGKTATTSLDGLATLSDLSAGSEQIVTVTKPGFITQVVRATVNAGTVTRLPVRLKGAGEPYPVNRIELAQTVTSPLLNAKVSFPANAFVNAAGQPAMGKVTVNFTPWDITLTDLYAMLGDGRGQDANGNDASLISAGMMTVEFIDNLTGGKLQLAPGKKATIRMDLLQSSVNNTPLAVGSTIPMWFFNESIGLWIEEGTGIVVASADSPTGLALESEVSHFTTWNWDFKSDRSGSVNVSCTDSSGPVDCFLAARITLPDGSTSVRSGYAPAGGITVINMPGTADIQWTATTSAGQQGIVTQAVADGPVQITLAPPKTTNFVRCQAAAGITAVFDHCEVDAAFTLADDTVLEHYSIPAQGATIRTMYDATSIEWTGVAVNRANGVLATLESSTPVVSSTSGNVNVALDTSTPIVGVQLISFVCATSLAGSPVATCSMNIAYFDRFERTHVLFQGTVPTGQTVTIELPPEFLDPTNLGVSASAFYPQAGVNTRSAQFDLDVLNRTLQDGGTYTFDTIMDIIAS